MTPVRPDPAADPTSKPEQPALLWLATAVVAWGATAISALPLAVVAAALVAAFRLMRAPASSRLLTAVALAPLAAPTTAPAALWMVAAGALAFAVARASHTGDGEGDRFTTAFDLQRHLARCRRADERADVMIVRVARDGDVRRLAGLLRTTDSVAIARVAGRLELEAVLDRHNLCRAGLEDRLRQVTRGALEFGWAHFPEDGLTLEVLLDEARRAGRAIQPQPARALLTPRSTTTTEASHA